MSAVRSLLDDPATRLYFAGHETFPLRHGWLKKAVDAVCDPAYADGGRSVFTDEAAIAYFGVGKNMVASIRHWALACGVLRVQGEDEGRHAGRLVPSALGRLMFGADGDPYLEACASLWLLHWNLCAAPGRATAWYWAFNEMNEPTFSRDVLRARLSRRCEELRESGRLKGARITDATIKGDVLCLIRTYLNRSGAGKAVREDNLECPLAELGLVQPFDVGSAFQFRRGPKSNLPDAVFLYGMLCFWQRCYPTRREFSVEALAFEPGSPGRVFLMDAEAVAERLVRLGDLTRGAIRWDESTGMRQVYAPDVMSMNPLSQVAALYARDARAAA